MAESTVMIDVIDKLSRTHSNISIINKPNPVYSYAATKKELLQLIQIPWYYIYEAGTTTIINGNNFKDYFPEGGGGGGGGDAYTKQQTDTLLNTKVDKKNGYDLSQENFTPTLKTKLESLENYDDTGIRGDLGNLEDKVDELQLYKFPNTTIIGSPTINNGQISNFSANNYMKFPFIVNMQGRPFTIMIEFTTASDVTNQQNIIDGIDHGIAFAVRSGKFVLDMGSRTGEWDITNGEKISSVTVTANTTYRVKISWDGSVYKFEYSTNGETYTEDTSMRVTSTSSLYPTQINIGVTSRLEGVFKGSINMNHCSLTISDKVVWTGMDDVGLATRMAVDMSNIDDAGIAAIRNIVADMIPNIQDVTLQQYLDMSEEERNNGTYWNIIEN